LLVRKRSTTHAHRTLKGMAPKNRPNADISQPFKFRRDDQVCDRWPASQVRIASLVLRIPSFSLSLGPYFFCE
jgi:hypothetical protein